MSIASLSQVRLNGQTARAARIRCFLEGGCERWAHAEEGKTRMINVIVTYTVKADRVAENEDLVQAVYDQLRQIADPDVHYATFKKADGCTFVHVAFFSSEEKQKVLSDSSAFRAFQADLLQRCEVPPKSEPVMPIDSYNFRL